MGTPNPGWPFEDKVDFLYRMAARTAKNCPALPTLIPVPTQSPQTGQAELEEISLTATGSPTNKSSDDWELELGGDHDFPQAP